jgi:cell division protein ZapA
MPLVNVLIHGRAYTLACDEGEEPHVRELGEFLDKRVRELAGAVGQAGDARLLLMAGLMVADELNEALADVEERDKEIAELKLRLEEASLAEPSDMLGEVEDKLSEILESTALRIEAIAAKAARA